jgi:hypothetical protein
MWGMVLSALTIAVSFLTESGREERLLRTGSSAAGNARSGGAVVGKPSAAAGSGGAGGWPGRASGHSLLALPSRLLDDRAFLSGACELCPRSGVVVYCFVSLRVPRRR